MIDKKQECIKLVSRGSMAIKRLGLPIGAALIGQPGHVTAVK